MNFAEFAAINRQRCEAPDGFRREIAATPNVQFVLGMAGEAGEAANAMYAVAYGHRADKTIDQVLDEIADVVSYADLACQRLGRSLEEVLRSKWNRVSERIGSPLRIADAEKAPGLADDQAFVAVLRKALSDGWNKWGPQQPEPILREVDAYLRGDR